jgi:hypothetical protein
MQLYSLEPEQEHSNPGESFTQNGHHSKHQKNLPYSTSSST